MGDEGVEWEVGESERGEDPWSHHNNGTVPYNGVRVRGLKARKGPPHNRRPTSINGTRRGAGKQCGK